MLRDDGVDPHGGVQYSRYDRVRVERVWKEALHKERELRQEAQKQTGPAKYTMNLANLSSSSGLLQLKHSHSRLEIIAEKVEKQAPQVRMSMEGFDPDSFEVNAMKYKEKVPTRKWDLPCTRAQEIGWLVANAASHDALLNRQRSKKSRSASRGGESPLQHSRSSPCISAHLPIEGTLPELAQLNTRTNPKSYRPRSFCPITRYADTYMSLMHHDPFNQVAAGR
mmetsp:Transcript_110068/g.344399  ORF Transcript_110068/g.344399 Transcript_110068/m.344399 type:complete len:224 (+) Transcript_110068:111-782(+)